MFSSVEQEGFYRTNDGSVVFVVSEADRDNLGGVLVLTSGSHGSPPGEDYYLNIDGSIHGDEGNDTHPMVLIERIDFELPSYRKWMPLRHEEGTDFASSRAQWAAVLADMGMILDENSRHEPPSAQVGGFYRTLNRSIAYVLDLEDGQPIVALLNGGAGERGPGYVYCMESDGSPGRTNPLDFALVFDMRLDLVLP